MTERKSKGMTLGQKIKRTREEEKEREEEERKKRGKETMTPAGSPRKGRSTPGQTRAIRCTLQYRTTSCLFFYNLILRCHLFQGKYTVQTR